MVDKRDWLEFRDSGLLWWINTMLHTFGWAIVFEFDDNKNITDNSLPIGKISIR